MQNKLTMKEFVINMLKNRIPPTYAYHNYEHTVYVYDKAIEIGKEENCTAEEIELLKAAALWHDTGYINTYEGHEEASCTLAREHLPSFGYSEKEITIICGMIMATKIPQSPKNKVEEVIADADLEYLGTENAGIKASHLFSELKSVYPLLTEATWNQTQITFIRDHKYFTAFCKANKEPAKASYLKSIKTMLR